LASISAW
jgi:DNA-directed RNA polymerase subunit E'/Rpb7